jgi:hypothetical protein
MEAFPPTLLREFETESVRIVASYRIGFIPGECHKPVERPRSSHCPVRVWGTSNLLWLKRHAIYGVVRRLGGPAKPPPSKSNVIPVNYYSQLCKPRGVP